MLTENLDVFFRDLGTPAKVGNRTINVLFDDAYSELELGAENRRIEARCKSGDAIALARGDPIEINNKTYKILQIYPVEDGVFSDLILAE